MQGTSCVRRMRLGSFYARIGSSFVFCNEWLYLFAKFYVFLEFLLADRIGMVASKVAWAILWGGSRSTKSCIFPYKVAVADDERYLVCAAGAAGVVSCANWFFLCIL